MQIILDLILMSASLTAIVFCYLLDRRLKSMRNATGDFGATIKALSQTIETARENVTIAKKSSDDTIDRLSPKIDEAKSILNELQSFSEACSQITDKKIEEIHEVANCARRAIHSEKSAFKASKDNERLSNDEQSENDNVVEISKPSSRSANNPRAFDQSMYNGMAPFVSTCSVSYTNNQALLKP